MLTDDTLRKVRETARIDEVASGYLTLHRSGKDFVALCPFHDERHPSFRVSPARNIGKCFSCGEAADPIRLVCHMEGCGFEEAVRLLARKYNIEVEETAAAGRERRRDGRTRSGAPICYCPWGAPSACFPYPTAWTRTRYTAGKGATSWRVWHGRVPSITSPTASAKRLPALARTPPPSTGRWARSASSPPRWPCTGGLGSYPGRRVYRWRYYGRKCLSPQTRKA